MFDYGTALPDPLKNSRTLPATCLAFMPVEADWTDERDLLGYPDPFGPKRTATGVDGEEYETHQTYRITDALKLMLRAMHPDYQNKPHFLILDDRTYLT